MTLTSTPRFEKQAGPFLPKHRGASSVDVPLGRASRAGAAQVAAGTAAGLIDWRRFRWLAMIDYISNRSGVLIFSRMYGDYMVVLKANVRASAGSR
jgi:hypothetical protein